MIKQSQERLTGNDAFEGFAIDLIAEIAEILSEYIAAVYLLIDFNLSSRIFQNLIILSNGLMMGPAGLKTKKRESGMV